MTPPMPKQRGFSTLCSAANNGGPEMGRRGQKRASRTRVCYFALKSTPPLSHPSFPTVLDYETTPLLLSYSRTSPDFLPLSLKIPCIHYTHGVLTKLWVYWTIERACAFCQTEGQQYQTFSVERRSRPAIETQIIFLSENPSLIKLQSI